MSSLLPTVPDPASVRFAAESLLGRVEDLQSHLLEIETPNDPEPIHQTRVVCRRIRSMFGLFAGAFHEDQLRRWDRWVRRLGKALSDARDLDVQIGFLDGFMADRDLGTGQPGLDRLRLRLVQRRRGAQKRLREKLDRFEKRGVVAELAHALREAVVRARLRAESDQPTWLPAVAGERIMVLAEQVLVHEPFVEQADRIEELHQMRIAAKHLRYALDVVAPLHGERLDSAIEVIRAVQRKLGDLHDCDVWIEFLPQFIARERKRTRKFLGHLRGFRRISQGLDDLLADRRRTRVQVHTAFVDRWHRECGETFWTELRTTVEGGAPALRADGERGE